MHTLASSNFFRLYIRKQNKRLRMRTPEATPRLPLNHIVVVVVELARITELLANSTVPSAKTPTYVEAVLTKVVTQDTKST